MLNTIISKLRPSSIKHPHPKNGSVQSEVIRTMMNEVVYDVTNFASMFNQIIYPTVGSLPGQPLQFSERLDDNQISPVLNGLDGSQIFVDRLATTNTDNGRYYDSDNTRPRTVKEQFESVYDSIVASVKDIVSSSYGMPSSIKERIGVNVWDQTTASLGTIHKGPIEESIDGRSLNNKMDLSQLAADIFGSDTNVGESLNALDYTFSVSHDGYRAVTTSLRERLVLLEELHNKTTEDDVVPSHSSIWLYENTITDPVSTPPTDDAYIQAIRESSTFKLVTKIDGDNAAEYKIVHNGNDFPVDVLKIWKTADDQASMLINANLVIQGSTTEVTQSNLTVTDNIIVLNEGDTGAGVSMIDAGIEINRGSESNVELLFSETHGWSTKIDTTYDPIITESHAIAQRVLNVNEYYRFRRTVLGLSGDFAYDTTSSTLEAFTTGRSEDMPSDDTVSAFTGSTRKYRIEVQYADDIGTDTMNGEIVLTGITDLATQSFTLAKADNMNDPANDNILYISPLFEFDFDQDVKWEVHIVNGDGAKQLSLYRVDLIAFDTF